MFGRKKDKRRKPGMTQAEISKLEEVGIRRGFFGKKLNKKDKEEHIQKHNISRPLSVDILSESGTAEHPSVLQRATMYGQVIDARRSIKSTSSTDLQQSPHQVSDDSSANKHSMDVTAPIAPSRRKNSVKSVREPSHYDVPKSSDYIAATVLRQPSKEAVIVQSNKYDVPWSSKTHSLRKVVLKKKAAGDFGLSLRRSAEFEIINNKEVKKTIYFAEPGQSMQSSSENDENSRLFFGDRLIEIDGINIETLSRDDIVGKIKSAGSQVTLLVQSFSDAEVINSSVRHESRYSVPRKAEPAVRSGIRTVPSLSNQVQEDGSPKLPGIKKSNNVKENDKKASFKANGFVRIYSANENGHQSCTSNDTSLIARDRTSNGVACVSDKTGNEDRLQQQQTVQVTPSELHASSTSIESCHSTQIFADGAKTNELQLNGISRQIESLLKINGCNDIFSDKLETNFKLKEKENSVSMSEQSDCEGTEKENLLCNGISDISTLYCQDINVEASASEGSQLDQETSKPVPDVIPIVKKPNMKWKQKDKIWYRTNAGIDEGFIVEPESTDVNDPEQIPDGKTRIELSKNGEIMFVLEDDVEMANEVKLDRESDLSKLRHLNESSMLHLIGQRFVGGLNFSFSGPHLISIRLPYEHLGNEYNFTTQIRRGYKASRLGDNAPHLYAVAQHAHHCMMSSGCDQSIIGLGLSGSGKTANVSRLLSYYASNGGNSVSSLTAEKVSSAPKILESFSSAANDGKHNCSRCIHVYNLNFDKSGLLAAVSVQALLLERSRLLKRSETEANFNIFYQLLYGADTQLRRELFLVDIENVANPLISHNGTTDPSFRQMAIKNFAALQKSFELLGISQNEVKGIFYIIAACVQLGLAGSQKVEGGKYQFARADMAQNAASLLGVSSETLSKVIFQGASPGKRMRSGSSASLKRSNSSMSSASNLVYQAEDNKLTGQQALEAFIVNLYAEIFRCVVSLVNRALSSSIISQNSIIVVDAPGYQNCYDSQKFSSYADLTFNYVQDRLHSLYYQNAFTVFKDRYLQDGINCDVIFPESDFGPSVEAVDQPPTLGGSGTKGLFWILDEEASSPGATDESFIERFLLHYGKSQIGNKTPIVERSPNKGCFFINHQAGACPVHYNATGWLAYATYNSTVMPITEILQESKKAAISELLVSIGEKVHPSVGNLKLDPGTSVIKRGSSFRKAWSVASGAAAVKKSMCMMSKFQTDSLIDALHRLSIHFVFSFVPNYSVSVQSNSDLSLDIAFLRRQLRGFQLLYATRTHKQGYPEHVVFSEFRRRFDVLLRNINSSQASNATTIALLDDKEATQKIIEHVEFSRSQFRIGVSQIFFRSGTLRLLEDRRNEKVSTVLVAFQAQCRGYLARKRFERRKIQVVAVRCIQRNIRKFMAIRQWSWWRLLTKVLPLVEVTRTEEQMRETQAELELLKEKFEKIQSERDELKKSNSKYESKLQDLILMLEEERNTSTHASDLLEHERKERLRLEKLLKETQSHHSELQQRVESMEVELAEKRLVYSENIHLDSDDDHDDEDSEFRMKYETAKRDFNFQMKKKCQEFEDTIEELRADKKLADRKIAQMQEELEDQMRLESQTKKKLHKINAELSDAKIHLEETTAKNHELEKKQRKFDSELYAAQASVTELKTARDRIQREKDRILMERNDLEKDISEKNGEVETLQMKLKRLEEELEDTDKKDSDDHRLVNNLKKKVRELDAKVKDQEEELEEQASTIHTLEHAKERLEMSAEQSRQQRQRELEGKEEEMEEMRSSYHKKIKNLEIQLEEGEEERAALSRQKRELEQEMKLMRDKDLNGHDAETEKRLRRDLKRYKALLADAQTMIDHLKSDVVSKQQMRQLKAQLEDLQYTSSAAVKSKKSMEIELEDLQTQLDEVSKSKQDTESRLSSLLRETHDLHSKLEEDAEDAQETLRKYRALVHQQTEDKRLLVEAQVSADELKHEKSILEDKVLNMQKQIQYLETNTTDNNAVKRLETKIRDLETKQEFLKTTTKRLEVQLSRSKENVDKLSSERESIVANEHREKEAVKRIQRQLRESKEEQEELMKREQEALQKKHDLEMELTDHQNQIESLQSDLKLAFKRINDLQSSLEEVEESDAEYDDDDLSSSASDFDDDFISTTYGLKRRSTSASYNVSSRSRASIRANSSFSNDLHSSIGSATSVSAPAPRKQIKREAMLALPVEETMSRFGKQIADVIRCQSRTDSRSSNFGRFSSAKSSSLTSEDARNETSSEVPVSIDIISKSLADEDPSFLLYGNSNRISSDLGIGRASSFHALNETLHAIKHRQNLPKRHRLQLQMQEKVDNEIEGMRSLFRPKSSQSVRSRNSLIDDDRDFDDVCSVDSCDSQKNFLSNHSSSSMRARSHLKRSTTENINSIFQQNGNFSLHKARKSSLSRSNSITNEKPLNETDVILLRHKTLQESRSKPFVSRFLQKAKERKTSSNSEAFSQDNGCRFFDNLNNRRNNDQNKYPDGSPMLSHRSLSSRLNGRRSVGTVPNQTDRSSDLRYFSDLESYSDQDDDDVSLSLYGVRQSQISIGTSARNFDYDFSSTRPHSSRSFSVNSDNERPLSREVQKPFKSLISRNGESKYKVDYGSMSENGSDYEASDPLDSIISKYLYRK